MPGSLILGGPIVFLALCHLLGRHLPVRVYSAHINYPQGSRQRADRMIQKIYCKVSMWTARAHRMTSDRGFVMPVHAGIPLLAFALIGQHWQKCNTSCDERERGRVSAECSDIGQMLSSPPDEDDLWMSHRIGTSCPDHLRRPSTSLYRFRSSVLA